jgi:chromosomal replication initiation ATPase DnaA
MKERGYEIGHSTIIHGIAQVEKKIEEDSDIRTIIEELR